MKIHIYCWSFAPAIGGMERLLETVANEFIMLGHSVEVVTETLGDAELPYSVYRRPRFFAYLRLLKFSDVILSAPLSLKRFPAQLLSRKRIVVSHPDRFGGSGLNRVLTVLKRYISRFCVNVVPSRYMAKFFCNPIVILNPYNDQLFKFPDVDAVRNGIVFVGRLVDWKGCRLLLEAFALISAEIGQANLTIVGDGPELEGLIKYVEEHGFEDRVRFTGAVHGIDLAKLMQDHAVMVVPTIADEPFGIVALEGLACGCQMVVARSGGLPEAVGPFAAVFEKGNKIDLADCLKRGLQRQYTDEEKKLLSQYLSHFRPIVIANEFLRVLSSY